MVHLKFPRQYAPHHPAPRYNAPRPDPNPTTSAPAHSPLPSRYTREQALGTKFELWVEGLLKDNGYSFVRQNIVFTRERYETRQVDVDYREGLLWYDHTIVECKYSNNGAIRLELRRGKEKRRQLLPRIETILEELEERRQFVKADKAILLSNQYFRREVYEESRQFLQINVYDRCWLKQLDKERQGLFSGFFQRKTIEQQIAEIELPEDKRPIWVKV